MHDPVDPVILLGAEVIAGNGLHTLVQSHHNHDEEIYDAVNDTEGTDGQVTVIQFKAFIDQDDNKAGSHVHQERSHTDADDIFYQYAFETVNAFLKVQKLFLVAEDADEPAE